MTDLITLVKELAPIILAIIAVWNLKITLSVKSKQREIKEDTELVKEGHQTLVKEMNGMKEKLIEATAKASFAEGRAEGKADERRETTKD